MTTVFVLKEDYIFNTRSSAYPIGVAVRDEAVAKEWCKGGKWEGCREYDAIEVLDEPPADEMTPELIDELADARQRYRGLEAAADECATCGGDQYLQPCEDCGNE